MKEEANKEEDSSVSKLIAQATQMGNWKIIW